MNCSIEKCPHRALLEQARQACLACGHDAPSGHGGMVSFEAAGENTVSRLALDVGREPRGNISPLPPDVEERVVAIFREWCSLDSLDALLMLHVANGGTPASFGAYLSRVWDAIDRDRPLRHSHRATVWARFKSLVRRFAPFLRGRLHAWSDGHGGAIRRERIASENNLMQGDLFALNCTPLKIMGGKSNVKFFSDGVGTPRRHQTV